MKTITSYSELQSKGVRAGETVIFNNGLYTFNGFSGYTCDNTLNNLLRKNPENTGGKNILIDSKYGYTENEGYLIIDKQNKNGSYHVTPYTKKGKKGSGFSIISQEIGINEICVGGKRYKLIKEW